MSDSGDAALLKLARGLHGNIKHIAATTAAAGAADRNVLITTTTDSVKEILHDVYRNSAIVHHVVFLDMMARVVKKIKHTFSSE